MSIPAGLFLDLALMETHHDGILAVTDVSSYPNGFVPQNPFLEVTAPAMAKQALTFLPRQINIYNSHSLHLSNVGMPPVTLPDGLWRFKYSIQPNYERFIEKTFFRINAIKQQFDQAFLRLELSGCGCVDNDQLKKKLDTVEVYLQAAMAAAAKCIDKLAMDYYFKAKKILDKLDC